MGQYYKPTCIPKEESLYSHDYNNGLKLMEHSYINNNFVEAVMTMLLDKEAAKDIRILKEGEGYVKSDFAGSWAMLPFVWAGDYADVEQEEKYKHSEEDIKQYDLTGDRVYKNFFDVGKEIKVDFEFRYTIAHYFELYMYNLDKKEYLSFKKYLNHAPTQHGFIIHPLPLLTADGNGRGGGDYHRDDENVGRWKKDRIMISKKTPEEIVERIGHISGKDWTNISNITFYE